MDIGLWGCGNMGKSLAKALEGVPGLRLTAVFDVLEERSAEMAATCGGRTVKSAQELLEGAGLEGVIIALPPYLHREATVAAAEAGVHVFVEKPMATQVSDCLEMIRAARENGIQLMVGQVLRYYEPYRSILRWVDEGRWGAPFAAAIWRITDGRRWDVPGYWRAERAKSGGYILEIGAHELDMLRCLLGRPESVAAAATKTLPMGHEMEDFISLQLCFRGGKTATYEGGGGSGVSRYGFRIYLEGATLLSDAAFNREALQVHDMGGGLVTLAADEFSTEHPVTAELTDWAAALRGERPVAIPGEEGMATVAIADAAYRSLECGCVEPYTLPMVQ